MEYVLPCKVSCGQCQSVIMDEGTSHIFWTSRIALMKVLFRPKHGTVDADAG